MLQDKLDLGALVGTGIAELAMKIVAALLILVIGLWLVKVIVKLVKKSKAFQKLAPEVQSFFASAIKVLGYALVIMMAITTVGVPTASILAVLGSCGLCGLLDGREPAPGCTVTGMEELTPSRGHSAWKTSFLRCS